jgi:hypothetical protein
MSEAATCGQGMEFIRRQPGTDFLLQGQAPARSIDNTLYTRC